MSIEVEVLNEVYSILKQYIPAKDRQEAADNVMSVMVDMLSDEELQDFGGSDPTLSKAMREYAAEDEDDYYNEDDE
jgi:hypothetical protein